MEQINSDDLFRQIRTAHRLVAAYYQRLIPTLDDIIHQLGIEFYAWIPSEFDAPCRLTTDITNKWQWDLLPGISTRYLFKSFEDPNQVKVGEYLIEFFVISDTGVLKDKDPNKHITQPDALNLPLSVNDARSVLRVQLYTPFKDQNKNWYYDIWNNCKDPNLTEEPCVAMIAEHINCCISGFEVPLAQLIEENSVEVIVKRIVQHKDAIMCAAKEESQRQVLAHS